MSYALLKNNDVVRIVDLRSIDNTYSIIEDPNAIYCKSLIKTISQDDVILIDSNINILYYHGELNAKQ